jgi:hypothetical protein
MAERGVYSSYEARKPRGMATFDTGWPQVTHYSIIYGRMFVAQDLGRLFASIHFPCVTAL